MPPTSSAIRALDFLTIAPEIVLTVWGLLVLLADLTMFRHRPATKRRTAVGFLALLGVGLAFVVALLMVPGVAQGIGLGWLTESLPDDPDPVVFFGMLAADELTTWMNVAVLGLLLLVVLTSIAWDFTEYWGEYFALMLWAGVGMMLLIASEELATLFVTLETMTLCLYLAAAFEKGRRRSVEGAMKYFVYGSVSSALFLFGLSYLYGLTGSTRIEAISAALTPASGDPIGLRGNVAGAVSVLLILVGFGFKIAAVPFHMWAPDVYEGAPAPVAAWIASGSKVASVIAMLKVMVHGLGPWAHAAGILNSPGWIGVIGVIAAASMTYGNLAALAQRNLKRLLAYSSIAHAGYMLVGLLAASVSVKKQEAAGAVLFYLVVYAFSTVGVFALAAWLARGKTNDDLEDLNGLGRQSPALGVCIVLLMLSLIGMPPMAGFFGKLYMFMEALNAGERGHMTLMWLVALALVNSVISAFYYVRVLKAMFLRPAGKAPLGHAPGAVSLPILVGTAVALVLGIFPTALLEPLRAAAVPMLSSGATSPVESRFVTDAVPGRPEKVFKPMTPEELDRYNKMMRFGAPKGAVPSATPSPEILKLQAEDAAAKKAAAKGGAPKSEAATKDATKSEPGAATPK